MELTHSGSERGGFAGTAANAARRALQVVVGVLLVDRDLNSAEYEDLFHMPW